MNVENLQCADASLETIHCQQSDGDSGDWMKVGLTESTLAEVCSLVTDGTHDTPKRVETGYPLVKAKEISGGRILITVIRFLSKSTLKSSLDPSQNLVIHFLPTSVHHWVRRRS